MVEKIKKWWNTRVSLERAKELGMTHYASHWGISLGVKEPYDEAEEVLVCCQWYPMENVLILTYYLGMLGQYLTFNGEHDMGLDYKLGMPIWYAS